MAFYGLWANILRTFEGLGTGLIRVGFPQLLYCMM